ncbi:MAG TPA: hypothetical protein V6C72_12595, partial [Chroococcales cyanobacterium]
LGMAVGHTVEVIEAIETLKGNGPDDLMDLCLVLGSLALVRARKAKSEREARQMLQQSIDTGLALEFFRRLIIAQGGDPNVIENYELMPTAQFKFEFKVPGTGTKWIEHLDGLKVADACKLMGAGRERKGEPINLAVGVVLHSKVGSQVQGGDTLATVHADSEEQFLKASAKLGEAFRFSDTEVSVPAIIKSATV